MIFYIGTLAILFSLYYWAKIVEGGSQFIFIFQSVDSYWVANIINLVFLTSALSI
ncbi:hypothetical protein [Sodalis-like endosymbiont of Proechinophthirus fluctus]|uniref:hypothetical protein n=1 Tax=Sodalis-like endosymbiont of Proechinophthirus fluctus TaxID=1462730 RepID=UPI000B1727FE|nr:hypothetical protein [Sodalis-like endosymbiont of Proechinophthirus fluctus]